jgi:pilus assembly protein CpaF
MVEVDLYFEDGREQHLKAELPLLIGSDVQCGVRVSHWRVAQRHARVSQLGLLLNLEDLGSMQGTRVNALRVSQHCPLLATDDVLIGPCRLRIRLMDQESPTALGAVVTSESDDGERVEQPVIDPDIRNDLHASLIQGFDVRKLNLSDLPADLLRQRAQESLREMLDRNDRGLSVSEQADMIRAVVSDVVGLGPLQPFMEDALVSEIMVNRYDQIFIEKGGALVQQSISLGSDASVRALIERIIFPLGRRIDDASPMVDARLVDGSRVNAVISPVALKGSCLTIRKFPTKRLQLQDLVRLETLNQAMADFLKCCVQRRLNILIAGGTGSGKTTLLNILGGQVPEHQRIVTIEDAAELSIDHPHVISLEARPPNMEGRGQISIRDLVRNALRMRPDRIIVGECRGLETIDMLAAMNTGHDGSLTTLHANSPRDALSRLETMVLMAGHDLPLAAIRDQIARAVRLVIQQTRLPDGRRVVTAIDELTGMESGQIQMQPLMRFNRLTRKFQGQGMPPSFLGEWQREGLQPENWFDSQDNLTHTSS